ncbi:hypothetical protein N9W41_00430 [bacterium]|nr:hypothetical protein [bacterium]
MACASRITNKKRKQKAAKAGQTRKAHNRNKGTTKTQAELFGDE